MGYWGCGLIEEERKRRKGRRRPSSHFTLALVWQLPLSDLESLPFRELCNVGIKKRTEVERFHQVPELQLLSGIIPN